jgi:hypothetical protein
MKEVNAIAHRNKRETVRVLCNNVHERMGNVRRNLKVIPSNKHPKKVF